MNATIPVLARTPKSQSLSWLLVALDVVERAILVVLFGWLVVRLFQAYAAKGAWVDLILVPSEGIVVCLALIRRTTPNVSRRTSDWLLAFTATTAPLLVQTSLGRAFLPQTLGAAMMFTGMTVQVYAKIALGRSFGCVPANRGVKSCGPYCYIRHPMYAGYMLTHLAFFLLNPTAWNLTMYVLCDSLQIPRILAEERLLRNDPQYQNYAAAVRYRLLPGVF
jgi:protein-S-isoprenylcysteine O-methyltransferase Ste14